MHSPTAFAGDARTVARKNGWAVLISAAEAGDIEAPFERGLDAHFPAIFAEQARGDEERS
jgi:hypothetical protein